MRGLSFGELLDYTSEETNHWRDWFRKNPAALGLACDIAGTKTVREVMLHIEPLQRPMIWGRFRMEAQEPNGSP